MSLILLLGFLMMYTEKIPREELTYEYLVVWALFSIADALWVKGRN